MLTYLSSNRFFGVVFFLVLFFSSATNLRFFGLVGLSELGLFFLILGLFFTKSVFLVKNRLIWLGLGVFFTSGLLGYLFHGEKGSGFLHTSLAYFYVVVFVFVSYFYLVKAYGYDGGAIVFQRHVKKFVELSVILYLFGFFLFFFDIAPLLSLFMVNLDFPARFSAWSANPNQLALYLAPVPFFYLWSIRNDSWGPSRCFAMGLIFFLFFVMALYVRSDALFFAWVFVFVAVNFLLLFQAPNSAGKFFSLLFISALLALWAFKWLTIYGGGDIIAKHRVNVIEKAERVVVVIDETKAKIFSFINTSSAASTATATSAKPMPEKIAASIESDTAMGVGMDKNKTGVRKQLWQNAFHVWLKSPMFGQGPGAFSYLDDPKIKHEAHNLWLDLLTQVGIVGVIPFALFVMFLVYRSFQTRNWYALAALCSLGIFSMAHFVFRMPIFWFYLIVVYFMTQKTAVHKYQD